MWLRILPLLLFALLALFLFYGLSIDPKKIPSPLIDQPAPQFNLPLLDAPHHLFSNTRLIGKPYLLNVWASWCEPCQTEHALLLKIAKEKKIKIYGLNYKDAPQTAKQFLQELGNPYEQVLLDKDGRIAVDLGVYGTPETFLIDAKGIVRYRWVGPLTETVWKEKFSNYYEDKNDKHI
jgi:cytochrome c biogenesis protein CcmG, thiol:disulfide interchange protein DsbE